MTVALAVVRRRPTDPELPDAMETELARIERHGDRVLMVLDDGETLNFDAWELIGGAASPADEQAADRQAA